MSVEKVLKNYFYKNVIDMLKVREHISVLCMRTERQTEFILDAIFIQGS